MRPWCSSLSTNSDWVAPVPGGLVECLKGRLWLLKKVEVNPQNQPMNKTPRLFFLNFSLILNSSFPSWGHLSYRGAGLCMDKQKTREEKKICPLKYQWEKMSVWWLKVNLVCFCLIWWRNLSFTSLWELCLWSEFASCIFWYKALVGLCWSIAEFNLISLLQVQPWLGKWCVSTGRAQDFGSNTGYAWPWSRKATFTLFSPLLVCGSTLQPVMRRKILV